jgi:catechol 2,3-dioxygenase-like lactoylglutathione lyase family enzyme
MFRIFFAAACTTFAALAPPAYAGAERIDAIVYPVRDIRTSSKFYQETMGFTEVSESEASGPALARLYGLKKMRMLTARLRLGQDEIVLVQTMDPSSSRHIPLGSRSEDLWFQHFAIIVSNMSAAYARVALAKPGQISTDGPQKLPANTGAVTAFKFTDPDRHPLELLYLPPGIGRPIWHKDQVGLFLGIDHSAIGISDTRKSLEFYRDLLGFQITGSSLNEGSEQGRLDGAKGAAVEITGLRVPGADGPGIELLRYRQPSDGRSTPSDTRSNDIWASQIRIVVNDLDGLAVRLKAAGTRFISRGIVTIADEEHQKALLVLDPDGHRILLLQ